MPGLKDIFYLFILFAKSSRASQDGLLCVEDGCDVNVFWPSVASTGKHSFSSGDDCCMRPRPENLEDYIEI